jgi:hypothetical protein
VSVKLSHHYAPHRWCLLHNGVLLDLRADPFERADITSNTYWDWLISHAYIIYGSQAYVAKFLETFKEFPPSQRAATITIDQTMDKLKHNLGDYCGPSCRGEANKALRLHFSARRNCRMRRGMKPSPAMPCDNRRDHRRTAQAAPPRTRPAPRPRPG